MADGGLWQRAKIMPFWPLYGAFIAAYGKKPATSADIYHIGEAKIRHHRHGPYSTTLIYINTILRMQFLYLYFSQRESGQELPHLGTILG